MTRTVNIATAPISAGNSGTPELLPPGIPELPPLLLPLELAPEVDEVVDWTTASEYEPVLPRLFWSPEYIAVIVIGDAAEEGV